MKSDLYKMLEEFSFRKDLANYTDSLLYKVTRELLLYGEIDKDKVVKYARYMLENKERRWRYGIITRN